MYKTIVEAVLYHAQNIPEKIAIGFRETDISYGELAKQIHTMAFILQEEYGVKNRDKIMLSAVSRPEYVVTLLALQYIGAVTVPVDKVALEENIVDVYFFNGAKLLLTDTLISRTDVCRESLKELYRKVIDAMETGRIIPQIDYEIPSENEVAEILFTTGTTGRPKGTMLSYRNIYASIHNTWEGVGMLDTEIVLNPLPLNHSVGMRVLRTVLYIGATMVIENGFVFPKQLKAAIERYGCTGFVCVPAVLERLYRQMGDEFVTTFNGLHYIEIGAGSLSYDMKKRMTAILPNTTIINTWGSTETGGAIFLNVSLYPEKLTSLGKPVKGILLKVVDPEGNTIDAHDIDTAGRMALQGPMQMMGYYNLEDATNEALVDGWLFTNDLVYTDSDGFVYMLGRADDIINVGGEKVSPIEIENIASEHPAIYECACIGVEDPEKILGQIPVLYYVTEQGQNLHEKDIQSFLAGKMESFKIPKYFMSVTELPRNRMKKLDRKKLCEYWSQSGTVSAANPVICAILSRQSIRDFTEREIPRAILEELLRCAIAAPTANNMQTWRFHVISDRETIFRLKYVIEDVIQSMEGRKVKFYGFHNPAAVILITNDRRNANGMFDCAAAAENLMLAAHSLGIGSVWNNVLKSLNDQIKIRDLLEEFGISGKHDVYAMICLGYPEGTTKKIERRMDVINWVK